MVISFGKCFDSIGLSLSSVDEHRNAAIYLNLGIRHQLSTETIFNILFIIRYWIYLYRIAQLTELFYNLVLWYT